MVNACTGTFVGQSPLNVKTRDTLPDRLHSCPRKTTRHFSDKPVQRRNNIILKQLFIMQLTASMGCCSFISAASLRQPLNPVSATSGENKPLSD